ncbi:MAG: cyclic nucleotide-binding domain-containing protein [Bacteriovoracaceae bacterium]|jgi:CRP-like cAMP-binding protein|nr:cyclic nucleotide-binding domain-containing protein [Bacteriovoracaceae bacterium]
MSKKYENIEEQNKPTEKININIMKYFWDASILSASRKKGLHSFLRKINVFKSFTDMELYTLSKYLHIRHYSDGEIVFREGDNGFGFYLILNGSVKILTDTPDEELSLVTELEKYEFFGELTLLQEVEKRSATAITGPGTSLLALFIPDFEDIVEKHPLIGAKVLKALSLITTRRFVAVTRELKKLKFKVKEYEQKLSEQ